MNWFRSELVKQAEEDYSKVEVSPETRKNIVEMSKVWAQYVPMSELALRGFSIRAMREWQERMQRKTSQIDDGSQSEKINDVGIAINIMAEVLTSILRTQADVIKLEGAKEKVLAYYKEHIL